MKKTVLLFVMALAYGIGSMASPVDVETARSLGLRFMNANAKQKSTSANLAYTAHTERQTPCFYVFSLSPKGFVIVSADDRAKPILGYSTESNFTLNLPDGLMTFFENYKNDISYVVEKGLSPDPQISADWEALKATRRLAQRGNRSVEPLVKTTWHQTQLYNDQCPEDAEGYNGHVKSGCVANAMAQLMRYWEWPQTGMGTHTYTHYDYGTLTANFGEAEYHFEKMPLFLDYTSPQAEVDAIALLQYHAGVSVEMNYGPSGSGAYSDEVPDALRDYFRYSNDMLFEYREYYSDAEWINMLKQEFDAGRPLYYSAYSPTKDGVRGGHAFVCDGYDENDFMHFNWGWQGFDNGFYSINAMTITHHEYNYNHSAVFNLHPNAEYYTLPNRVGSLSAVKNGNALHVSLNAPSQTVGGTALSQLDSVVLLLNNMPVHTFVAPQPGAALTVALPFNGCTANYLTAFAVNAAGNGLSATDTLIADAVCHLTFHLHDSKGDGWLSPAISVLDSCDRVIQRVGLTHGSDTTLNVNVPDDAYVSLYWNYCNVGYEDDDAECSFEVYDADGDEVYASSGKPTVGLVATCHTGCGSLVCTAPFDLAGEYEWRPEAFGVRLTWDMEAQYEDLDKFLVYKYVGSCVGYELLTEVPGTERTFFHKVEPGRHGYLLTAVYRVGTPDECESDPAPTAADPSANTVHVVVTAVSENEAKIAAWPNPVSDRIHFEGGVRSVRVYDAIGQCVYEGAQSVFEVSAWNSGVYFVKAVDDNGKEHAFSLVKQ